MSITEKQYKAYKAVSYKLKLIQQGKEPDPDEKTLEFAESIVKNADAYRQATEAEGRKRSFADSDIALCQWALSKYKGGSTSTATAVTPVEATWNEEQFPEIRRAIGDTPVSVSMAVYGLVVEKAGAGYNQTAKGKAYRRWVVGQIAEERATGTYDPKKYGSTLDEQKLLRDAVDADR